MKVIKKLHVYGEYLNGQWSLMCLDFSLAVQSETLSCAQTKLSQQIEMYIKDVQEQDSAFESQLLSRKAPSVYWLKFYFFLIIQALTHQVKRHFAESRSLPNLPCAI